MAKKLFLSLFLILNTWALEDRALFSIEDRVFFSSEINKYIEAMNFLSCYMSNKTNVHVVSRYNLDLELLSVKDRTLSPRELDAVATMATVLKTIRLSGKTEKTLLTSAGARKCSLKPRFRSQINEILSAHKFLEERIISKGQTKIQRRDTLENYKKSFDGKIRYRRFY
jgi:hypothetical protein